MEGVVFRCVFLTTEGTEVPEELAAVIVSFQLSLLSFLWHGRHVPLTPDPSPPFHGGEGGFGVFEVQWKKRQALAATGWV